MSAFLNLIKLKSFRTYPSLKLHLLFNSNGLAIWHSFPIINFFHAISLPETSIFFKRDGLAIWERFSAITYIQKWTQVGYFKFDQVEIFHGSCISLPETDHLLNGPAIWPGFSDIDQ